jgi:hypothetical protein
MVLAYGSEADWGNYSLVAVTSSKMFVEGVGLAKLAKGSTVG